VVVKQIQCYRVLKGIETGKRERQCRYFKAKVLKNNQVDGTDETLLQVIDSEKTIVFTNKSISYVSIADYVELHISEKSSETKT